MHGGLCGNDDGGEQHRRHGNGRGSQLFFFDVSVGLPRLLVVVKSKPRWRGLVVYDDARPVVRPVALCDANLAYFPRSSPSKSELRCLVWTVWSVVLQLLGLLFFLFFDLQVFWS